MKRNNRGRAFSFIPTILGAVIATLAGAETCFAAQYRLSPGDTVEVRSAAYLTSATERKSRWTALSLFPGSAR